MVSIIPGVVFGGVIRKQEKREMRKPARKKHLFIDCTAPACRIDPSSSASAESKVRNTIPVFFLPFIKPFLFGFEMLADF